MKIYNHIDDFIKVPKAVVTIGTFDGVHIGHQKIISRLLEVASQENGESVILTFFPHPRMILHPEDPGIKLISTMQEKAERLEKLGIDHLIITPFTRDFSNLSPQEYIRDILVGKIGTRHIITGYDHRFGKDRKGGLEHLFEFSSQFNFDVEEIPEQDINEVAVSSTRIRNAVLSGDVQTAQDFLGYPFQLNGRVIRGDQIGRSLGYPTANLFIEESYKIIPADGIYAASVEIGKAANARSYQGMAYVGHRPTINGMNRNIEVNIFNFNEDIYNQAVRINFIAFIRGDQKFDSLDELTAQLGKDEIAVRHIFD